MAANGVAAFIFRRDVAVLRTLHPEYHSKRKRVVDMPLVEGVKTILSVFSAMGRRSG